MATGQRKHPGRLRRLKQGNSEKEVKKPEAISTTRLKLWGKPGRIHSPALARASTLGDAGTLVSEPRPLYATDRVGNEFITPLPASANDAGPIASCAKTRPF